MKGFSIESFFFGEGGSPNLSQSHATQNPGNALCPKPATSQAGLAALIESVGSVEAAGEAIYSTLFEAAPSISVHNGSLDGDIFFFENRSAGTGKSLGLQKKMHPPTSKPSL